MKTRLHQSVRRMKEATQSQKALSKLQRILNRKKKCSAIIHKKIKYLKTQLSQYHKLVEWAIKEKRIAKKEASKFTTKMRREK